MLGETELSPIALRCLDRQLAESLDLAFSCHEFSDRARCDGQPLTVVVLQRLASDLTDLAAFLIPLVGSQHVVPTTPRPATSSPPTGTWFDEIVHRLEQVALAAEVDAVVPGLGAGTGRLLSKLAALYESSREMLLAAAARDGA